MAVDKEKILGGLRKEATDIGMVILVVGILMAMLLPVPPFILDFFLVLNITTAIIIIITTMYTMKALEFSVFPSVLLVLTLFRLSLNVASTRLILLHGSDGTNAAGSVIMAFGTFVVGGDYVVGMIVFIIIVLVNFMVITKGSGRIAEVAARFTLDGMPGKQMAIDADLNAGIIDEDEAKSRRKEITQEAEFHGAMDGASKFVRGDAIAGIVITFINIIGGFIIGVVQMDMKMGDAAQTYTILTIGDGLVSQVPALIISTATGILVTRSGSTDKMGKEFAKHIFSQPVPIYIGSFIVFLFGIIPGLPAIPFMTLGLMLGLAMYFFQAKRPKKPDAAMLEADAAKAAQEAGPEDVDYLLTLDAMELEVGYGLIPFVDKGQDGSLLGRIRSIRRQFASEMGIIVPPIHIRDNLKLKPSQYSLMIKGVEVAGGELMAKHLLAMDPGEVTRKIEGIPTTEPAFNLPAVWIPPEKEEDAKFAGYTVVDNSTVMATHITEIIRNNAADLLGRQEVQHLLDNLMKTNPKAVEELVPGLMSLGNVQKVLQNLLRERVSVRDLLTIVEVLADYASTSKDPDLLTEYVRQKLARSIVGPYIQEDGALTVITVDQKVEDILAKGVQQTDHGAYLSVAPDIVESMMASIKEETENMVKKNMQPVIICSPTLRRHLRKIVEQLSPLVAVLSHAELLQNITVKSVGKVMIKHGS